MNEEKDVQSGNEKRDRFSTEETVGEILLASRERKEKSLEEVSEETRISLKNLEYLETDNFEALPAKVYVRGFLRTYALYLGLDVGYLLNKYEVQSGQTHKSKGDMWEIEAEVVEERLGSQNVLKRFLVPAVVIIVVIALLVVLLRMTGDGEDEKPRPVAEEELAELVAPAPEIKEGDEPESIEQEPPVDTPSVMELRLTANPSDSTWFELLTISTVEERPETTAYNFLLLPGRARVFEATEAFILKKVGNAGGFFMDLNDVRLPPVGSRGRVLSNVEITREDIPR